MNIKNNIIHGDCKEVMKEIPNDYVDAIITDPPYALVPTFPFSKNNSTKTNTKKGGFLGLEWDNSLPDVCIWEECLRVMKSGSFMFVFMTPRQDSLWRLVRDIESVGFVSSFTSLYHVYASGFPKALNISNAIDKKLGCKRNPVPPTEQFNQGSIDTVDCFSSVRATDDSISQESSFYKGWYTFSPKPAIEIITVYMKPLIYKSYTEQSIKYFEQFQKKKNESTLKCGCVNFDECRIPYFSYEDKINSMGSWHKIKENSSYFIKRRSYYEPHNKGRFPSNLLVSDNIIDKGRTTCNAKIGQACKNKTKNTTKQDNNYTINYEREYNDCVAFYRYFDIDFWFKSQIQKLPIDVQKTFPFFVVSKPCSSERDIGIENTHPCVKSLKIISYLIVLSTRENDIILDPFIGSGTTAIVCKLLNRNYIGIEKEKEYYDIALKRMDYINKNVNNKTTPKIIKEIIDIKNKCKQLTLNDY